MAPKTLIKNARLADGSASDLLITDGHIIDIGSSLSSAGADIVDADGLIALPGLVDLHTHLREPGFEESETVWTGTQAAARGGYTAVFAMANTDPVADSVNVVDRVKLLGEKAHYAFVQPIGAVTKGLLGEKLSDIPALAGSRAQVRVFSDDGKCVFNPQLMREALEQVRQFDGVIAQHAQDPYLTIGSQMDESELSRQLGLTGWPSVAEEAIIARDVLLAEYVGARLHVCHVSTAGSVDVIRWAKKRGINVTAEVTPHHLLLTRDKAAERDARFKVNPPLRSAEDVEAVRAGLADGTIDIVATDHAPHPSHAKECAWNEAAFGMVGLESALAVVNTTMVQTGRMSWNDVARAMSITPAQIGRLAQQGNALTIGAPANISLIDPAVKRTFSPADLAGKSSNSPYLGDILIGDVIHTFFSGAHTLRDRRLATQEEISQTTVTGNSSTKGRNA